MDLYCYFASLGCDKNLVDSEKMMALLEGHEVIFTDEPEEAQIIIVNTCGFILDAKQESIETVIELAEYKKTGKAKALIVTGCLAERYKDEIRQEIPEVDAIVGTSGYDSIWEAVRSTLEGLKPDILKDRDYLPKDIIKRISTTNPAVRYLKIAE
ncbi:MAG: 30S ribosomal protein S12 methylthiotransferase RimO, partial [Eubacterium sp.]|nr:30S ribosomal protein S12 methylthiotransferase RimO [Eubacterium sp.]